MRNEGTNDQTLLGGENNFRLLGLSLADLPGVTSGVVQRGLGGAPVDANQQRPVLKHCWLGTIAPHNLLGVHRPVVVVPRSSSNIGKPRIGIDKRSLNLKGGLAIHAMAMNNMSYLKTSKTYVPDALYLIV